MEYVDDLPVILTGNTLSSCMQLYPIYLQDVVRLEQNMAAMMCSLANKDDCLMCGS